MYIAYIEFKTIKVFPFTILKWTINYAAGLTIQVSSRRSEFKYILVACHIPRTL